MLGSLQRISNFKYITEDLAIGGQPPVRFFPMLRKAGFGLIVHIEVEGVSSLVNQEDLLVYKNEMLYEKISVNFNQPNVDDFLYLAHILDQYRKLRIYVHCATGHCCSGMILPFLTLKYGWSLDKALESVVAWNIPPLWEATIEEAIAATV